MRQPHVLVLAGYGLNCEEETAFAYQLAGATATIVHIADLIAGDISLDRFQILTIPGGFSYGDDTGSGNAYANKVHNHLWDEVMRFLGRDTLVLGICNGFQILVNLGLVPALEERDDVSYSDRSRSERKQSSVTVTGPRYGDRQAALVKNDSNTYINRWIDLVVTNDSPWLDGLEEFSLPIAHGEGKFVADSEVLQLLDQRNQVALRYTTGEIVRRYGYESNPNGSINDIAAVTDPTGRVLGMMPHPERGMFYTQLPDWTYRADEARRQDKSLPDHAAGLQLFKNAVRYFTR
ncbi:MAG: phosphoribosylformylglycinamidine synthase subunit PurQ [Patescibacteria group bacterium]